MAQVSVVFLQSFVHGHINAVMNRSMSMEKGLAMDLERAGLLRIRGDGEQRISITPGKESDDGQGQPSSVSQAAPVSHTTIVKPPADGGTKTLKVGK